MTDKQLLIAGGVVVVGAGLLVWKLSNIGKEVAETAGGVLSGNNALTEGTPYEDAGILGSLGAAANEISGGVLEDLGGGVGIWLADLFHPVEM